MVALRAQRKPLRAIGRRPESRWRIIAKIKQTVRKLQELSIEWRKERAGRNFSRFRPIGRLMRPEGVRNARIRADEPHRLKPRRRRSSPRRRGC